MKNSNSVSREMLTKKIVILNKTMGTPELPWHHEDGKNTANVGCFYLEYQNNSFYLYQMENTSGGVSQILWAKTKGEMWNKIEAMLNGIEMGREIIQ